MKYAGAVAMTALLLGPLIAAAQGSATVTTGKRVGIEYTLSLPDGTVADSNVGKEPLEFVHGEHKILPGVEEALEGMGTNDERKITLTPDKAYGKVDPNAFLEVPLGKVPADARYVDALVFVNDPSGNPRPLRVHEVGESVAILDMNHPLAGKTLTFQIRVISIE